MSRALVLTAAAAAAAVFVSALTKSRWRNRAAVRRASFEVLTDNVKAAANKVDTSAARVELALKPLMAA
jgi:LPS O-antigen subunit length determinant protein (WzzB/FepE family)